MSMISSDQVPKFQEGFVERSELGKLLDAYRAAGDKARIDTKAYLVGFMGLTGICLGFAVDTAQRVETWVRSGGAASGISLKLAQSPTTRIQHYEKLLTLSVFQSLHKGDDWREIRQSWDAPLVGMIHSKFQQLIKMQTGIVVTERRPAGEDLLDTTEIPSLLSELRQSKPGDHFLVFFTDPNETIYKRHVVYIHPQSRHFADGANCLTWAATATTEDVFLDTIGEFLKDTYSHFPKFFVYKAQFESIPLRSLLYDRVCSRVETFGRIALQSPSLAACFAASYVLPGSCLQGIGEVRSLEQEFYGKLKRLLKEKNFPEFLSVIQKQIPRIPSNPSLEPQFEGDLRDYNPLFASLEERGSHYTPITAWLRKGMIEKVTLDIIIFFQNEDSTKDPHRILQQFFGVKGAVADRLEITKLMRQFVVMENQHYLLEEFFKIREFGDNTTPGEHRLSIVYSLCRRLETLEVIKKAVSYGANPFADFYPRGDGPIDVARKNGFHEVVDYLESVRAGGASGAASEV